MVAAVISPFRIIRGQGVEGWNTKVANSALFFGGGAPQEGRPGDGRPSTRGARKVLKGKEMKVRT